ncbi:MAG: substrate-binding domain-containing protein [Spirochaetes bacterium]|nr:substrate-binding domain-containing protein [Spirochaetota bacterium]
MRTTTMGCVRALALVLVSLSRPSVAQDRPVLDESFWERMDGSTATIPLSQAFARALLGVDASGAKELVKHTKTFSAYKRLLDREVDLVLSSLPPPEILAEARARGFELVQVPVTVDALVFIVRKSFPVTNLASEQVRKIYSGEIVNWKPVGGPNVPITAYQRNPDSGSQSLLVNLVMRGVPVMEAPVEHVEMGMGGMIDRIAEFKPNFGAIGYTIYSYELLMYPNKDIKLLAIDSVYPDADTLSSGRYPFQGPLVALFRSDEKPDGRVRAFVAWMKSDEAVSVMRDAGFLPAR